MVILDVTFLCDTSPGHEGIVQCIRFCLKPAPDLKLWLRPDLDKVYQLGKALECNFGPSCGPSPSNERESRLARCLRLPHSSKRNYGSFWGCDALRLMECQCPSQFEWYAGTSQKLAGLAHDFATRHRNP